MNAELGPLPAVEEPNVCVVYDVTFANGASLLGESLMVTGDSEAGAIACFWRQFKFWRYEHTVKSIAIREVERRA